MQLYELFKHARDDEPYQGTGYHWAETNRKALQIVDNLTDNPLFFSDDPDEWASPWRSKGQRGVLVSFKISMKNPAVYRHSERRFEQDVYQDVDWLKDQGYDGVIYTPHKSGMPSIRQGLLFYPKRQIKNAHIEEYYES